MRMLSDVRLVNNISSAFLRCKLMEPEGKYFTGTFGLALQAFIVSHSLSRCILHVLLTVSSLCTLQMQQRRSLPSTLLQ